MTDTRARLIRGVRILNQDDELQLAAVRVRGDGSIAEVASDLRPQEGESLLEGEGLVCTPGFIDLHSHSDLYSLVPDANGVPIGDAPKLVQGCTAQIFGQDGISAAPVADADLEEYSHYISALDGHLDREQWAWRSFAEYLAQIGRRSITRTAGLVGHSTVRRLVMGMANRPPTADELGRMRDAVAEAMRAGALGISTGLVYAPAAYAATEELTALCQVVASFGGRLFVHVRSESDRVIEASEEVLEVARETGVHLHYSHIKVAGRANWHLAEALLVLVQKYREVGVTVTSDIHPYTAGSTMATVLLPPWVLAGGVDDALRRLADPSVRARVREQVLHDTTSWDNWWAFSGGWEGLRVAEAHQAGLVGRSFEQLLLAAGHDDTTSESAFDTVFDLLAAERLEVALISFNNVEENIIRFLQQPYCSIGSDALVNPQGHPHPRLYGTFARVLGRYVRELGVISLPEAIHKMTDQAADAAGWRGVGRLVAGAQGDLVIFDPDTVADLATYESPRQGPVGVRHVLVGGRQVVVDGHLQGWSGESAAAIASRRTVAHR